MNKYQLDIEKYLDGHMDLNEKTAFETRLKTDITLLKAYEDELSARELIKEAGRLELKETLHNIDREMGNAASDLAPETGRVMPLWMKRALPLAAMIIIFLGVFQYMRSGGISSAEVYDSYFEPYAAPSVVRDSNEAPLENWETAANLYAQKKYEVALPYFEKAQTEVPEYLSEFYRGMSHLSSEAPLYSRAITAFDKVLATDNDYTQQAMWYKALALLEIQNKEEAFRILESIVANQSYNHKAAAEILKLKIK